MSSFVDQDNLGQDIKRKGPSLKRVMSQQPKDVGEDGKRKATKQSSIHDIQQLENLDKRLSKVHSSKSELSDPQFDENELEEIQAEKNTMLAKFQKQFIKNVLQPRI